MPYTPVLFFAFFIAAADWLSVEKNWRRLEWAAKPGVMLALLLWTILIGGWRGPMAWFSLGLVFSLAGDIFLMLPEEQFIPGLVSFLLAHLCYIAGFNTIPPPITLTALLWFVLLAINGWQIYRRIAGGLEAKNKQRLKAPVLLYSVIISLMLLSALLTPQRTSWEIQTALLAILGAALFFLSDTLLAWNKFVSPLPHGRLAVIITYHLGQLALIIAAAHQFLF